MKHVAALIILATSVVTAPAAAEVVVLDTTQLPSLTGWTYVVEGASTANPESSYYQANGVAIDQDTRGVPTNASGGAYYRRSVALGAGGSFRLTVDAVVRQFEGTTLGGGTTYPFGFVFGIQDAYFGIAGERLGAYSSGEGVRYFDLPNGFRVNDRHLYTLTAHGGAATLVADGTTLFDGVMTGPSAAGSLIFGDGTGYANAAGRYFDLTFNSTVPEPATWAMMVAGFGLVGLATRRRATRAAALA